MALDMSFLICGVALTHISQRLFLRINAGMQKQRKEGEKADGINGKELLAIVSNSY